MADYIYSFSPTLNSTPVCGELAGRCRSCMFEGIYKNALYLTTLADGNKLVCNAASVDKLAK